MTDIDVSGSDEPIGQLSIGPTRVEAGPRQRLRRDVGRARLCVRPRAVSRRGVARDLSYDVRAEEGTRRRRDDPHHTGLSRFRDLPGDGAGRGRSRRGQRRRG